MAEWVRASVILESDCSNLIEALKSYAGVVGDIHAPVTLIQNSSLSRQRERGTQ